MTFASDGFYLEEISRERNGDMLRIMEDSPIETRGMTIGFERAPDIFAIPELFSERVACVGFLKGEELFGFAMMSFQERYVDGAPRSVMYYGNVHVKTEGRGHGFFYRVSDRIFRCRDGRSEIGYAIVMSGNRTAEKFIGRGKPGYPDFPASRVIGVLSARNILILGRTKESAEFSVRRATLDDVDAMVLLLQDEFRPRLFGPIIAKDTFLENAARRPGCGLSEHYVAERGGEIVGTCAAWDMERLRQTRIIHYGAKLKIAKKAHALFARLAGFPQMPGEGDRIKDVTITDCAVRDRKPEILEALLRRIYNELRERKFNMMTVGSCRQDPLLRAARGFIGYQVVSNIVLFAKDPSLLAEGRIDASLPYVDLAMV
ncbi:MAG: hypothetical protein ACXW2O_02635 [Candidatus Aminicenantales bacterium]